MVASSIRSVGRTSRRNADPKGRGQRELLIGLGDGSRPLYKEVKLAITKMLSSGAVTAGQAIPTEKQLCDQYGVSVGTVRKAIDELVAERILIRQQGRGTFFASYSPERMLNYLWHIVRRDGVREIPIVQTLRFQTERANADAAEQLNVAVGDGLFRISNLLLLGGAPVVLDEIWISQQMFPGLTEERFAARDTTIYAFYQSEFGLTVLKTLDKLAAVAADSKVAKLLGVALSTPLLEIRRIALTFDNQPVEMRRSLMLSDHYEYVNMLQSELR